MRAQGLIAIGVGFLSVMAAGCDAAEEPNIQVNTGAVEIRINAEQLAVYGITHVVAETSNLSETLIRDPSNPALFAGAMILPVGQHEMVARAYADTTEVGVSNPTPVNIEAGVITRVSLRILDTTGGQQPDFAPIIVSLTHPASAEAGSTVSFSVSAVHPTNDPVSILWTDDCDDSAFSAPDAETTGWSKASEGACHVTVIATSNNLSVSESFSIVVFPEGSTGGAANIDALFISAPYIYMSLYSETSSCTVYPDAWNATCPGHAESPTVTWFDAYIPSWGNSAPGSIEFFDNCGGTVQIENQGQDYIYGRWIPPVDGQVCFLTARATNGDGVVGTLSAAMLVRDGAPFVPEPPQFWVDIYTYDGSCWTGSGYSMDCGYAPAGTEAYVVIYGDWANGAPGDVIVRDDCGGHFDMYVWDDPLYQEGSWFFPSQADRVCNLTVEAVNQTGVSSLGEARLQLY